MAEQLSPENEGCVAVTVSVQTSTFCESITDLHLSVNRDDFISRYRMTNMSDKDIRASTVTG